MGKITVDIVDTTNQSVLRSRVFESFEDAEDYCESYNTPPDGSVLFAVIRGKVEQEPTKKTPFQRVTEMNEAFGNPKGDAENINWTKVRSQCKNVFDEYLELLGALGVNERAIGELSDAHTLMDDTCNEHPDVEAVRDALCDIQVFSMGAQHLMGYDGDNDMDDVVDGVMTRFVKDDADMVATEALHWSKGVTEVYFEGKFPKMVMKSAVDQPDAPKGKFLKSASYVNTVFRPAP